MTEVESGEITSRDSLGRLTQLSKEIEALIIAEDTPPEELTKALDHVQAQWLTKVESIGLLVKDYEHTIKDCEEEKIRLEGIVKILKLRVEWLKTYTMYNMIDKDENKLQFPLVTIAIRNNPPSVAIIDEKEIPSSYTRIIQEIKLDIAGIRKELMAGKEVPGASLITDRKRLEIK